MSKTIGNVQNISRIIFRDGQGWVMLARHPGTHWYVEINGSPYSDGWDDF